MPNFYKTSAACLKASGTSDLFRKARAVYNSIVKSNRRMAYVRSRYFGGDKVFLDLFWAHLKQKNSAERQRRLMLYPCAIELIRKTTCAPESIHDSGNKYFRFFGTSSDGVNFAVQIKRNSKNQKYFMSVFPLK